jgi:hypothetical protein
MRHVNHWHVLALGRELAPERMPETTFQLLQACPFKRPAEAATHEPPVSGLQGVSFRREKIRCLTNAQPPQVFLYQLSAFLAERHPMVTAVLLVLSTKVNPSMWQPSKIEILTLQMQNRSYALTS